MIKIDFFFVEIVFFWFEISGMICATNGNTYLSECHMRQAACQQQKFIVVAFRGSCDGCLSNDGICSCPKNCTDVPENSTVGWNLKFSLV